MLQTRLEIKVKTTVFVCTTILNDKWRNIQWQDDYGNGNARNGVAMVNINVLSPLLYTDVEKLTT